MSAIDPVPVAITAGLLVAAVGGMGVSWRRRRTAQQQFRLPDAPAQQGAGVVAVEGLYLATTFAGRPLDRVVAGGLGFRAAARLVVTTTGVRIERDGSEDIVLPTTALTGAGIATWTIDRTVEKNGLTVLGFRLLGAGDERVEVEAAFRIDLEPRAAFIAAVRELLTVPAASTTTEVPNGDA